MLQSQFDLSADDQKVAFTRKAIDLVASLPTAVEREVYGGRVADLVGISAESIRFEVDKACRRRTAAAKKKQAGRRWIQPGRCSRPLPGNAMRIFTPRWRKRAYFA